MSDVPSGESVVHGRDLSGPFEASCDVVVVGSGAGGSVVATLLAEAGLQVIVLEEGPYYRPEEYQRFRPSEALRRLFRESGMATAFGIGQTPIIAITMGRAVGGSSLLTGGVCFRIPSDVHHHWVTDLGLDALSERALEPAYEDVERRLSVREVPAALRSRSTMKFVEGAEKLGITMKPMRRNAEACEGNARCNFTCPAGAKRSVDVSYLPSALAHGARIVSDALVTRVRVEDGRAAGVEGWLLGGEGGRPSFRFVVRAPVVVAACGTLHTPLLLGASGVGRASEKLGRRVTLHPGVRCVAMFDEEIGGWDGAMQSVYSDDFASEGIKLVGVYSSVNVLAASMPGVGPRLRRMAREVQRIAVFGAMVHDEGGGTVRSGPGREPILTYEMAPRDLARLRRGITIVSEMALAAGAREVYTSVTGADPVRTMDDALALERLNYDARRLECMAFHPLGSARAANDPRRGVVDPDGQTYELPGLFVADGSILPTSIGVNSQVPIMAMATRIAWRIAERFRRIARPS
ncbi:GMC family oxidoreductase N-terminal domain-containing protein [Polyangium jinanense]|uniref:GMC family oxidoreductase n=1 Tax=Polyangium jinanense TaxID=2829994 RepID=A0A9X3X9T1_9BACT|nr:GMC family oxidoreductase [Polyangium jinanense]MDC3959106.1 GMC family oxidoreductase [Polyangium jinanense]MDC3983971.1 GMC family oxidoreductase [Polyangium jinanense]